MAGRKFVMAGWMPLAESLLRASGVDPNMCSRLVLDLKVGHAGRLYLETFADADALDGFELSPGVVAGISVERCPETTAT